MTQDEQDAVLLEAQTLAPPGFTIDRCRHESITETTLWVFHKGEQVGSANQTAKGWTISRIYKGSPFTRRTEESLPLALSHLCQERK